MVVPAFGIELLGALKPLLREVRLAFLAERDGELEGRFGLGFSGASFFHAALVVFVGEGEFALRALGDPVAEGGNVGVALGTDDFAPDLEFLVLRGRGFGGANDAALLVDPNSGGDVRQLIGGADGVGGVDERRVSGLGGVVPLARGGFPACVLRGGDEFKALGFEFLIDGLPAWQIEAASSPGGPTEQEDFAAAEVGEADGLALAVGDGKVRGDAGLEEAGAEHGHFAEAPEAAFVDEGLTNFAGEAGEVERVPAFELLGQRDADISAAGALGFDFEAVDLGQCRGGDPEVAVF